MRIRAATIDDVAAIAALAGELGYASTPAQMQRRLERFLDSSMHAVFVAELDGNVVGWIQLAALESLESDVRAEIHGLIVSESQRGRGIGAALVARGEAWARDAGYSRIRVRSNIVRERTRAFYERLGYIIKKTQHAFDKNLGGAE